MVSFRSAALRENADFASARPVTILVSGESRQARLSQLRNGDDDPPLRGSPSSEFGRRGRDTARTSRAATGNIFLRRSATARLLKLSNTEMTIRPFGGAFDAIAAAGRDSSAERIDGRGPHSPLKTSMLPVTSTSVTMKAFGVDCTISPVTPAPIAIPTIAAIMTA
jgi:hypothetical protein